MPRDYCWRLTAAACLSDGFERKRFRQGAVAGRGRNGRPDAMAFRVALQRSCGRKSGEKREADGRQSDASRGADSCLQCQPAIIPEPAQRVEIALDDRIGVGHGRNGLVEAVFADQVQGREG